MPRIKQYEEKYALEDFKTEIRIQRARFDMKQYELASAMETAPSTLSERLSDPGSFTVRELRGLVKTLSPDIAIMLQLLGYDSKSIKKFREAAHIEAG